VLNDQKLTLQFNNVLAFDLADAKVAAPPNIASITQRTDGDSSAVDIVLVGEVDVHSFREEKNYVIDVAFQQVEKPAAADLFLGEQLRNHWPEVLAKPGPDRRTKSAFLSFEDFPRHFSFQVQRGFARRHLVLSKHGVPAKPSHYSR